jgi:hypothetical protein
MEYLEAVDQRLPAFRFGATLLILIAVSSPAIAQTVPVGRVKMVSGAAFIMRGSGSIPAKVGDALFETDGLSTGPDGRIGVTLRDETRVSLAGASEVRLDRFLYSTAEGRFAFVLRIVRGVAAYASGRIAKLAPDAVRLETPAAIVGVRGTQIAIRAGR